MTQSKYDPNKNGNKTQPHIYKLHEVNGVFYPHGISCKAHDNCFTCPFPDCTWNEYRGGSK